MPPASRPLPTPAAEVLDLIAFLDASPTPYHAVAEARRRLDALGYQPLLEQAAWQLSAGDRRYVVRGGGSIVAFELGSAAPADAGFHIIGTHTDSPNLRIKPRPDIKAHGCRQLAVEPYGGVLLHTWLDRDLGLAGRVGIAVGSEPPRTVLVDIRRAVARIPSLAIHLYRELRADGLKLNEQTHMPALTGLETGPELTALLLAELEAGGEKLDADDILSFDLMFYDLQGAAVGGSSGEFLFSGRLDNLSSTFAALSALLRGAGQKPSPAPFTRVIALHDHEEVGSRSSHGAAGTFLLDLLERVAASGGGADSRQRALAHSTLVSADMAHALHPNYADRHEPGHKPLIGGGPVLKINAGLSYASDAESAAMFAALCRRANVPLQRFVTRSDLACGSTIGPISAARVGLRTVDVGSPMLSMHSAREMAGTADVEPMIRALSAFFEASS